MEDEPERQAAPVLSRQAPSGQVEVVPPETEPDCQSQHGRRDGLKVAVGLRDTAHYANDHFTQNDGRDEVYTITWFRFTLERVLT